MADHNSKSPFSAIGLAHKFFLAFWAAGGTTDDANKLAETPNLLRDILKVLRGEAQIVPLVASKLPTFPIWRTIKVGTHKTIADLLSAIEVAGLEVSGWARDISKKVSLATALEELELVCLSVADLGFKNGATHKEIYEKALSLGLQLCPAEAGLQLRLQYPEQLCGEWVLIAMDPIADSDGGLIVFNVDRADDARWLLTSHGHPDIHWDAGCRWVFLRGKPPQ